MSSVIWESGQAHREIGEKLNQFLYKDGKPRNPPEEHSLEEMREMLEQIRVRSWDEYDNVARQMAWK